MDPQTVSQVVLDVDAISTVGDFTAPQAVGNLTQSGNSLFFAANNGEELWTSDGTTGGTQMLMDLNPNSDPFTPHLIDVNGTLFFTAMPNPALATVQLFTYDGVNLAPVPTNLSGYPDGAIPANASNFLATDGELFFYADDTEMLFRKNGGIGGAQGPEIWHADATEAEILPSSSQPRRLGPADAEQFTVTGGHIFFRGEHQYIDGGEAFAEQGPLLYSSIRYSIRARVRVLSSIPLVIQRAPA